MGVEAALRGLERDWEVGLLERGRVGEHLRRWHGVTMFTPFGMNRSEVAVEWADRHDVTRPADEDYLTGEEYVTRWLEPMVAGTPLSDLVRTGVAVEGIGREGFDKSAAVGSSERTQSPFRLVCREGDEVYVEQARRVIDASGTFGQPNPAGSGGVCAPGENVLNGRIERHFPTRKRIEAWSGCHVLLVGSGYSAATNLLRMSPDDGDFGPGRVSWLVRNADGPPLTPVDDDPLPRRRRLAERANERAEARDVDVIRDAEIDRFVPEASGIQVEFTDGRRLEVDSVVSNTGYRPDRSLYRELQVHECYATEGPIDLAASLLDQQGADCLDVDAGGAELLEVPEPDFYLAGSKAFGRNANFLLETGFDQLDDLFERMGTGRV